MTEPQKNPETQAGYAKQAFCKVCNKPVDMPHAHKPRVIWVVIDPNRGRGV